MTSSIEHTAGADPTAASKEVTSLGRPWRPYSRVVYIDTELPADVTPQGWNTWGKTEAAPQAYYAEFNSTGPGANPPARVPWSHQLSAAEVEKFKPKVFLAGSDHWDAEAEAAKLP